MLIGGSSLPFPFPGAPNTPPLIADQSLTVAACRRFYSPSSSSLGAYFLFSWFCIPLHCTTNYLCWSHIL
jgi:hypothetical protein